MATDLAALVARLRTFNDPEGLTVLAVGCGGGRVASQGEPALAYIQRYRGQEELRIPMRWAMALFPGETAGGAGKENG